MTVKNKSIVALAYRIVLFSLGVAGLVLICDFKTGGFMRCSPLVFYTVQTNVITTIVAGLLAVWTAYRLIAGKTDGPVPSVLPAVQLAATLYIFVTFFVYWAVLYPSDPSGAGKSAVDRFANVAVHGIVPVLAVLDWIFFMPHGRLRPVHAVCWLSYPVLYYLFTIIRAHAGAPLYKAGDVYLTYPYFFIDVGYWDSVLKGRFPARLVIAAIVVAMILLFYGLSRLCVFLDGRMARTDSSPESPPAP